MRRFGGVSRGDCGRGRASRACRQTKKSEKVLAFGENAAKCKLNIDYTKQNGVSTGVRVGIGSSTGTTSTSASASASVRSRTSAVPVPIPTPVSVVKYYWYYLGSRRPR